MAEQFRPRLFVASSKEGLEVARSIQEQIEAKADADIWDSGVFGPTDYFMERLEQRADLVDCSVFVITPDDVVTARGKKGPAPRDNVVLELGLFIGKLGRRRAVIFTPTEPKVKLPSDLSAITTIEYRLTSDPGNMPTALGPACNKLKRHLDTLNQKASLSWTDTCNLVRKLAGHLNADPQANGYYWDAIVGLARGGVIVADLLSRVTGGRAPIFCLWAEWDETSNEYTYCPQDVWVNSHVLEALRSNAIKKVLLVDAVAGRGTTLARAKKVIENETNKTVKTAVLVRYDKTTGIDYWGRISERRVETPFVLVNQW
jgi:hypoxanthine phosphoribosyltransferase